MTIQNMCANIAVVLVKVYNMYKMARVNVGERKNWVLLALAAANGKPLTPVQLQKCLFLLSEKAGMKRGMYKFKPYDYGPFAPDVYQDAEQLERDGLVNISYGHDLRWKTYLITPEGKNLAEKFKIPSNVSQQIDEIVTHVQSLDFSELVKEIYRDYPDFRANSIFRD